jgi:arabinofuranosyltransferase
VTPWVDPDHERTLSESEPTVTGPDLLIHHGSSTGNGDQGTMAPIDPPIAASDHADIPSSAKSVPRRASKGWAQAAVLALPVVVLAVLAWTHRSMFFDGYIYLHVVQNVLAGHGPVFNAGQRVEAFTSPLWTFVLATAGLATPFSLDSIAVDLGILFTVSGLGLAVVASTRLVRRTMPDAFLLPLGAMVFVAVSPVWSLASLGLETGLTLLWLGTCLALLVGWAGTPHHDIRWYGLVVLGLGPLVRPELGLDTLVFIGILLVVDGAQRAWTGRMALVAWAFFLPVAYEVFRMGYYGMLIANTAVAKEASLPRPGRGIRYLTDFSTPYWLFVPALALVVGAFLPLSAALRGRSGATRNRCALVALPLAAALNAGYITVMGGDYVHARLLIAPFFAACAPVAAVPMARKFVISLMVVPWALVCAVSLRSVDGSPFAQSPIILVTGHGQLGPATPNWGTPDRSSRWLNGSGIYLQEDPSRAPVRIAQPPAPGLATPTVATNWVGTGPYELGTQVQFLDLLGLADPLDAHLQLSQRGDFSGHEKPLPTPWMAALLTAPGSSTEQLATLQQQRPRQYTPMVPEVNGAALDIQTAWARAALSCPPIHAVAFGTARPLTFGGFLDDIVHAASRTTVRIPPDPETAYHSFCGPGIPTSVRSAGG